MNTATPAHPANNFDFVRIVAATLVLYSHQYALSGQMEPSFFGLHSFGGFAVLIFFAISGYLVTQSWYSDPNILRFALRRLLRIWPALAVVVTLTALVLGPVVSSLPAADYYAHGGTWQYFLNLRFIAVYILPEAFVKNPYPLGVNGSIWTIPIEVLCYLVLAVCGLAGLLKKKTIWLAAIVIYLAWYLAQSSPDLYHSIHQKREMGAYFLSGSALYVLREYWQKRPWTWLAALALLAGGLLLAKMRYTALLAFMPYAVISLGTASTPFIRRFGRYGDFSYGIYLFAFPVQQTVIMCLYPEYGFWTAMMLSMAITAGLAFLSWHLVEKPALRFKPSKNTMSNTRFCLPERINFYALYLALFAVYFSYLLIFWPGILGEDSLAILLEVESNREFQSGKPIFWYLFVNSFYKPFNLVEIPVIVQILVATAILARILTYVYNENGKKLFFILLVFVALAPHLVFYTTSLYSDGIYACALAGLLFETWICLRNKAVSRMSFFILFVSIPFAIFARPNGIINIIALIVLAAVIRIPKQRLGLAAISLVWVTVAFYGVANHKHKTPIGTVYPVALFETVNFLQPHAMGLYPPRVSAPAIQALESVAPLDLIIKYYDRDYWDPLIFFPQGPALASMEKSQQDILISEFFRHNLWRNIPAFMSSRVNIFLVSAFAQGGFPGPTYAKNVLEKTKSESIYRRWGLERAEKALMAIHDASFENRWLLWSPLPGIILLLFVTLRAFNRRDLPALTVCGILLLQLSAVFFFSIAGEYRYLLGFFASPLALLPIYREIRKSDEK